MGTERDQLDANSRFITRPSPHRDSETLPFQEIVESFPDGIAVQAGGHLVFANPSLERMLGYDPGELELLEWTQLVCGDDLPRMVKDVDGALRRAEGSWVQSSRRRLVKKSGEKLWVELSAVRITWNGAPALAFVVRDRAERERLESGLREADRLAEVGTLAAGVAHEINNPLAYVVANVAFAAERLAELTPTNLGTSRDSIREALIEAQQGIDRVGQVASDLKTFTRSEERIDLVNLREVLQSTVKMARPTLRHRATLVLDFGPAPSIKARASRLAQVFLNLLVNAAYAIADGGQAAKVTVRLGQTSDNWALVEIEDTGAGIAPEILPRIFEPFFTTKPAGIGTGLGLAVCRNIVQEHGGKIVIESRLGKGTLARVTLPPAPSSFVPHLSAATVRVVRPRRYRVLVIDDDPLVLKGMQRLLQAHDVTVAAGGQAALDILDRRSDFDVILCDLMMPEVTGMDIYERLSSAGSGIERKILFVSGGAVTARARQLLERVPNVRLEKPLDPRKLEETLMLAVQAAEAPESEP